MHSIKIQETPSMASPNMSLKLLVDKKAKRVLFAEATKEFVDFLIRIFSFPLGNLVESLSYKQRLRCLGKLKESVEVFNEAYLLPGIDKHEIVNPRTAFNGDIFLPSDDASADDQSGAPTTICRCHGSLVYPISCRSCATVFVDARCPSCAMSMNLGLKKAEPKGQAVAEREAALKKAKMSGGYVKELVTYMVMDDLVVKPMSAISSISLLTKFDVKDLSQLEEKTVSFDNDVAMKLLLASLISEKVLTIVFLVMGNEKA